MIIYRIRSSKRPHDKGRSFADNFYKNRSRQLHMYRNGKKVLVLAGKSAPKIIRDDRICEMI